ncbi:N-6 DNA methylase [uncultured Desulfobacter sp.]|uniref:N-6 DNA methylase n=1 Tax=uncultured Desulfobacter sp. TaxID=240139 RepID=UPI002AAC424F|nr:N-6 DNA methylase [uncultured Desulfobacter sp.]
MDTKKLIDKIFKDPKTKYDLSEFDTLGKTFEEIIDIYPKQTDAGRDIGKVKYFLKSFVPLASGKEEIQVFAEGGKSCPEEIVRQLWIYKLIHTYGYQADEIELEKSVYFGSTEGTKAADIVVYTDNSKQTPKIIVEVKKPKRKDGIEQLKSYLNAEGSPVGLWSNGSISDRIILYRPYPKDFNDTLSELPKRNQQPRDVLEARRTLGHLERHFNFKEIIQGLEELVLADSGKDEFNEIFKLIFAKIWDEKEADENRPGKEVEFCKALDPEITYDRINNLFRKACDEWPGIFRDNENIELTKRHLHVCIGNIERVRLMGSNLRIMDDAFEYLLPTEAKKKKGQFFTPRHVVEMCVRMLNPTQKEYVMDPACGSAGFLLHAMEWCYPADNHADRELRMHKYASKYLWGVDFEERAAKTSRALMLIAGDGHTKIFGPDVSSLDPKTWHETMSGQTLMQELVKAKLLSRNIDPEDKDKILKDDDLSWKYFDNLQFNVVLANPPFAGEMKDKAMLGHYDLAKPALKRAKNKSAKEERDVLFIERIMKFLKPGGRAAIVLPQGKFNNSSLAFIREWILRKARLLAVVGLHPNTFKPHTGTKTSVLFVQKYTEQQLAEIEKVKQEVQASCPDYASQIKDLIQTHVYETDIPEQEIPEEVMEMIQENFSDPEPEDLGITMDEEDQGFGIAADGTPDLEDQLEQAGEQISGLRKEILKTKTQMMDLDSDLEALDQKTAQEIDLISQNWEGTKKDLNKELKPIKEKLKADTKTLKAEQKETRKKLKAMIVSLEKNLVLAEEAKKRLTLKGRLELAIEDGEMIEGLKLRWIDAEVAKKLDYPIFMAVSERGGKNNSGDYEYQMDSDGNILEDASGQPLIDQDLVNYSLKHNDLSDASALPEESLCVAEAFVRFAQKHDLDFWRVG